MILNATTNFTGKYGKIPIMLAPSMYQPPTLEAVYVSWSFESPSKSSFGAITLAWDLDPQSACF